MTALVCVFLSPASARLHVSADGYSYRANTHTYTHTNTHTHWWVDGCKSTLLGEIPQACSVQSMQYLLHGRDWINHTGCQAPVKMDGSCWTVELWIGMSLRRQLNHAIDGRRLCSALIGPIVGVFLPPLITAMTQVWSIDQYNDVYRDPTVLFYTVHCRRQLSQIIEEELYWPPAFGRHFVDI